jgi:hypothetical protein
MGIQPADTVGHISWDFPVRREDPRRHEEAAFAEGGSRGACHTARVPSGAAGDLIGKAGHSRFAVEFDGNLGIHYASYAVQLLQRTHYALTEEDAPGADIR